MLLWKAAHAFDNPKGILTHFVQGLMKAVKCLDPSLIGFALASPCSLQVSQLNPVCEGGDVFSY